MQNSVVRHGTFLALVIGVTLTFLGLIQGFLLACFWAAVLAIIFRNTFRRLRIKFKGKDNLAAVMTTVFILLVVILPLFFITVALVDQSSKLYQNIQSGQINAAELIDYVEEQAPVLDEYLQKFGYSVEKLRESLSDIALNVTQFVGNRAIVATQSVLNFLVQFTLMLYLLFFFLRDGKEIMQAIVNVLPLGNRREWALFRRFAKVARATLKGTMIVAIVQGTIGGLLFALVGIQGAVFWGVVMTLLALLPVGGSGVVWLPAAIIMFIQGHVGKGVIIIVVGSLIIGLVDNLLRPLLVGRDTQMPDYLILLSTLGGIAWFGLTGFILGPVIAALFLACWEMVGQEYGGRDK